MRFLLKTDSVRVVKTNRKTIPYDIYIDNPILFYSLLAVPFASLFISLLWFYISSKKRRRGKVVLDTRR